jgi:hypothetical protein
MTDFNVPLVNFKMPKMPEFIPAHVQEAERFQSAFREIKAGLTELLKPDEELALFYFTGAEDIRVRHMQIKRDMLVLLYGFDASGNYTCAVTHVKEVKLVFKKLKLDETKERTTIGFSLEGEKEAPTPER